MSETSRELPAESVGSPDAVLDALEAMQPGISKTTQR